jgi:hypothetical protein
MEWVSRTVLVEEQLCLGAPLEEIRWWWPQE